MNPGLYDTTSFLFSAFPCFSMLVLSLPLLGLGYESTSLRMGSVYVAQGSTVQLVWSWTVFLDSLFCLAGSRGCCFMDPQ